MREIVDLAVDLASKKLLSKKNKATNVMRTEIVHAVTLLLNEKKNAVRHITTVAARSISSC